MDFECLSVGNVYDEIIGEPDTIRFDINGNGGVLLVLYNNPTDHEISQFSSGADFEVRFTEILDMIILTFKFGDRNWMDAPYSPHISQNLNLPDYLNKGEGMALTVLLFDTVTGQLKSIRVIGLATEFTIQFMQEIKKNLKLPFNRMQYEITKEFIYSNFTTVQIAEQSKYRYKLERR